MRIYRRAGLPRMSFHVINRGARKAILFERDADKDVFVDKLGRFCVKNGVVLTAWCLMTNHYHLEPDAEGTPLGDLMHDLNGAYARYFNEKYGSSGCLFQGPYKSLSIHDAKGLAYVSRYIHLNPRDMGVDPLEYRWSSCRSYLGLAPTPSWLDPMPVLRLFGSSLEESRRNYRFYLETAPPRRRPVNGANPENDYLVDYLEHVERLWSERRACLPPCPARLPLRTLVCGYAHRRERVGMEALRLYLGYETTAAVRVLLSRFARRLREAPELRAWFEAASPSI